MTLKWYGGMTNDPLILSCDVWSYKQTNKQTDYTIITSKPKQTNRSHNYNK